MPIAGINGAFLAGDNRSGYAKITLLFFWKIDYAGCKRLNLCSAIGC